LYRNNSVKVCKQTFSKAKLKVHKGLFLQVNLVGSFSFTAIKRRYVFVTFCCGYSSPTPCRSRVTYSRPQRTLSRWVLNISREGDSTTSLGSLFQCSVILRGKKFFLLFRWNFLCFSLCPLPLGLSMGTTEMNLAPSS